MRLGHALKQLQNIIDVRSAQRTMEVHACKFLGNTIDKNVRVHVEL